MRAERLEEAITRESQQRELGLREVQEMRVGVRKREGGASMGQPGRPAGFPEAFCSRCIALMGSALSPVAAIVHRAAVARAAQLVAMSAAGSADTPRHRAASRVGRAVQCSAVPLMVAPPASHPDPSASAARDSSARRAAASLDVIAASASRRVRGI